ncbi:alpha/beta hydrolase [Paenibacillus sp. TRM 82003]|nr:alpha/beta hydrolase [Paenibacillus sp. TRM 82003]
MTQVYRKDWMTEAGKAVVVLIHGQGEHCGRYEYVANALGDRGYDVVSGDLPGHGRSAGLRGHIDRFDRYLEMVDGWVGEARGMAEGRPVFLLGHSVGGLIAARYLETRREAEAVLSGAVLSSPALRLRLPIPPWKERLGRRLDGVLPRLRLPSGVHSQRVTRNEEVLLATAADPFMVYVASVRFFNELTRAQEAALAEAGRIRLPLQLLQGGADEIVDPSASLDFGARVASPDKDVRVLDGLHHEVMNEPERDEVLRDIADWLDRHMPTA